MGRTAIKNANREAVRELYEKMEATGNVVMLSPLGSVWSLRMTEQDPRLVWMSSGVELYCRVSEKYEGVFVAAVVNKRSVESACGYGDLYSKSPASDGVFKAFVAFSSTLLSLPCVESAAAQAGAARYTPRAVYKGLGNLIAEMNEAKLTGVDP